MYKVLTLEVDKKALTTEMKHNQLLDLTVQPFKPKHVKICAKTTTQEEIYQHNSKIMKDTTE